MTKTATHSLTYVAIGAALIAVLSQITIPIGPVPFTLQTLAIGLLATLYKPKEATLSVIFYLLLGGIGLPVFAGFSGGFSGLLGPTAGFLWGFILYAAMTSTISKPYSPPAQIFLACLIGTLACFIVGILAFKLISGANWADSLAWTVLPFILPELVKMTVIVILVRTLQKNKKKEAYFS